MAYTTQYIGSRYVPLFADPAEWDSTRTYEPLTIVMHDGNSYTSRQYVPTGIEITNEKFWALTGNYNAQVEKYRQDVTAEKTRAEGAEQTLQTNIDAEKTRAEGAEQTLQTNIDAEKTRAEGAEQTLQTNIDAEKTRAEGAEKILESKFTHKYNTVNDMIADTSLSVGMIAQTLHYANIGDNGGATYVISNNAPGIIDIQLNNGNTAGYVFQNEMHADQFPFALDKNLFTLFMNSTARVLDLDNRTLVYPCSDGVPNGDKTIRNGSITVNSFMFSIGIDDSYTGNITLDNLDITCVIPSTATSGTWSLRAPSSTSTYTITSCHISCKAIYGGGWCPLYTLADNLIIKDNYIDASNLASTDEGACIWELSYEDNNNRNRIEISGNYLISSGGDEILAIRNNNYKYISIHDNIFVAIGNETNRNFIITITETDDTSNHPACVFFTHNQIQGNYVDTEIETNTLVRASDNIHEYGSYGVTATKDGRQAIITDVIYKNVRIGLKVRSKANFIGLKNLASTMILTDEPVLFTNCTVGHLLGNKKNVLFTSCTLIDGLAQNCVNCQVALSSPDAYNSNRPVINLVWGGYTVNWINVSGCLPFFFQNQPNSDSVISFNTDVARYSDAHELATQMNHLPNCTITMNAPHLQGHKDAS